MLAIATAPAFGQELSVYNVVSDSFPRITANYLAIDEIGRSIDDLTASDFRIIESTADGRITDLSASVTHACRTASSSSSASIVLIVDESFSMDQVLPSGKRRIDYVKEALVAFVDRLPWNGETAVSIIGFSGKSRMLCDWYTTPAPVLQAISRLKPLSATNYEVAFLGIPNVFDQMSQRPPSIPKVAFFITDGAPNPDIQRRQEFEQIVTAKCKAQGIRLYSVTLMISLTDASIFAICKNTGGRSIVATEDALVNLVSVLAFESTNSRSCTISWISPLVCSDVLRKRNATIQMKRGTQPDAKITYTTPDSSMVKITMLPSTMVFGDLAPSQSVTLPCMITAVNTDLKITATSITTPAFFQLVGFSPFSLKKGESKTLSVKFTQGAERIIRQGTLSFVGTPSCTPSVTLVAGGGNIVLTSPNGGEVLTTCNAWNITWTGVPVYQPVTLQYTCDGKTWNTISDSAYGGSYIWTPNKQCASARVRVMTIAGERFIWPSRLGGTGTETATTIDVSPDGSKVYAGGYFVAQTEIGPVTGNSVFGATDGYLAELDADGTVVTARLLRGDVGSDERIVAVRTDRDGNIYVAATAQGSNVTFGTDRWTRGINDVQDGVLYKLLPNGTIAWRLLLGGTDFVGSTVDLTTLDVRVSPLGDPEAVLVGTCTNFLSVRGFSGVLDERDVPDFGTTPFSLVVGSNGAPRLAVGFEALSASKDDPLTTIDASGYHYATGSYRGPVSFPTIPPTLLANRGQSDVFITKTAVGVSTDDVSNNTFRIVQPILSSSIKMLVFDSTAIGRSSTISTPSGLQNLGTAVVFIDSVVVSGAHPLDFAVIDALAETSIDTGSLRSIEIAFTPTAVGTRTAHVMVYGACSTNVEFDVTGPGRQECPWQLKDSVDMGRLVVNSSTTRVVDCVLRSERRGTVRGSITVNGSNAFSITPTGVFTLRYGECVNVRVTFTPKTPGIHTAQIELNLPMECGIAFTQVFGECVLPELLVSDVDLGNHRLITTAWHTIHIVNNGIVDAVLTSLDVVDIAGTGFAVSLPTLPLTLGAGNTLGVPVRYTPTVRGTSVSHLHVKANGIDTTLIGTMRGAGYQPICEARGYSFAPVLTGTLSAENGFIRIYNRDNSWPLHIESVRMVATQTDFAWTILPSPFPSELAPNDSISLPVLFTPQGAGVRTIHVDVDHDGRPGPGPLPPYSATRVLVDGVGLQRSILPPVRMDTILSCLTRETTIELVNDDPTSDLSIQRVAVSGDIGAFRHQPQPPFIIPAGGTKSITLTFAPPAPGRYAASYVYENTRSLDLTINVSGQATRAPLNVSFNIASKAVIGQPIVVPIDITVGDLSPFNPTTLTLEIVHPSNSMRYGSIAGSSAPGWTFVPQVVNGSTLRLVGTSDGTQPLLSAPLVTVVFDTYLTASQTLPLTLSLETPYTCIEESGDETSITVEPSCFVEGRLISLSGSSYGLDAPRPSPATNQLMIPFGIGLAGATLLEIVNSTGQTVLQRYTDGVVSGRYELHLDVTVLASGVYMVRLQSGPFLATQQFVVIR